MSRDETPPTSPPARRRRGAFVVFALFVAALVLLRSGEGRLAPPALPRTAPPRLPDAAAVAVGARLPDLRLSDLGGADRSLDEWRGRVLVLNFFATWCDPCLDELPSLVQLERALAAEGLAVVGVSVDRLPAHAVRDFATRNGIGFPVLHDPDSQVAARLGVFGYPNTFVADRDGWLVHVERGAVDWSDAAVVPWMRALLARPPGDERARGARR